MSYGHDVVYQYCIDCFMYFLTMLLVWSRNWKRKQAYFEKIKSNPENLKWVGKNLTGQEWKDLKVVSDRFGLPMLQAKQLIDFYKKQSALIYDLTIELD